MSDKNWPIETQIPVLWGDMDSFGHVNNIIYLKWCETSRVELFRKIWDVKTLDTDNTQLGKGIGPILANFNCNYKFPVKYPDEINVKTRVSHIGNSSFGVEHEIFSINNENRLVFEGNSVIVLINYNDGSKFKINSEMKKNFENFF